MPILWAPGIFASFLHKNLYAQNCFCLGGGGECRFNFFGRGDFSEMGRNVLHPWAFGHKCLDLCEEVKSGKHQFLLVLDLLECKELTRSNVEGVFAKPLF